MSDGEPIITIRGLGNSFGEQVIHEDLDLDVRAARSSASSAARAPASRC